MAEIDTTMIYDGEEDILYLSKGRKVKASIDIGDFIIDVDSKGFVAGIEILNASQNLNLTAEQLMGLKQAAMRITYKPNYVYIFLVLQFKAKEKDVSIPLTVDLGHGSVKTESTKFTVA